jgi:tRNA(Glu) U13 pseudouridine synthase TruD
MTPPPLHRPLSTIGIGPVFICPPPQHPLPQFLTSHLEKNGNHNIIYSSNDQSNQITSWGNRGDDILPAAAAAITTWEIVGDIKSIPEDFVVREIGYAPSLPPATHDDDDDTNNTRTKQNNVRIPQGWTRQIAGLNCITTNAEQTILTENQSQPSTLKTVAMKEMKLKYVPSIEKEEDDNIMHTPASPRLSTTKLPEIQPEHSSSISSMADNSSTADLNPIDGLRRILRNCIRNTNKLIIEEDKTAVEIDSEEVILQQLTSLQMLALEKISSNQKMEKDDAKNSVWILFQTSTSLYNNNNNNSGRVTEDWTYLHRYIRQEFPLLRTETSSIGPLDIKHNEVRIDSNINEDTNNINKSSWVCVHIDYTYFSLAPYLAYPREDLLELYKFRNCGPIAAISASNDNRVRHQRCKTNTTNPKVLTSTTTQGMVLLRLRCDLPREERRLIHQSLTSSRRKREFDTSTQKDDVTGNVVIVVEWSRNAIETCNKKRKRVQEGKRSISNGDNSRPIEHSPTAAITATFCVLRKYQCEHQAAVTNVVRALHCRASDVGLAGIKDMQAITYQFCTLRNVCIDRAQNTNKSLGKRIKLSNFITVIGSNVLLDRGKLVGNQFEIVIRNLKRVELLRVMDGDDDNNNVSSCWKERTVPVHSSHLDEMVKRIHDFGFINFYGEQRVGDAGSTSQVGVRSFDIGRAMLQQDFATAVDLIMIGRTSQMYNPGLDEIKAREVWKSSGGDARQTLKAFPSNRNIMIRERDLMKGLLRYNDPLEALRCIPHNVRMFYIHGYQVSSYNCALLLYSTYLSFYHKINLILIIQSYVWNKIATERIQRWGLKPVIGDLYYEQESDVNNDVDEDIHLVKVVKDPTDINMSQIVLPLPGYNIQYPQNEIGELYKTILHDDGIDLVTKSKYPESTAKGSYRKLIQRANNLTWSIVARDDEPGTTQDDPAVDIARFTFELESGCYATMMLRELMVTTMSRDTCKVD